MDGRGEARHAMSLLMGRVFARFIHSYSSTVETQQDCAAETMMMMMMMMMLMEERDFLVRNTTAA